MLMGVCAYVHMYAHACVRALIVCDTNFVSATVLAPPVVHIARPRYSCMCMYTCVWFIVCVGDVVFTSLDLFIVPCTAVRPV